MTSRPSRPFPASPMGEPGNEQKSLFASLRRDIDRMLFVFGLSQDDVNRTLPSDSYEGGNGGTQDGWPGRQERKLLDGDEEQRGEAPVSLLRSQERRKPRLGRVLPLARVPLVRLAQRAARLRCVVVRGGHDWREFRANGVLATYYCADCKHEQRRRPTRDRIAGRLA